MGIATALGVWSLVISFPARTNRIMFVPQDFFVYYCLVMSVKRSKPYFSLAFWHTLSLLLALGCVIFAWQREPVKIIDLNEETKVIHLMMREHIRDIEFLNQELIKQNLELTDEVYQLIKTQPKKHSAF